MNLLYMPRVLLCHCLLFVAESAYALAKAAAPLEVQRELDRRLRY